MRLAKKMGQSESYVKGWISEVNDFIIKQNQFVPIDESVLRTKVAVHQTIFAVQRFLRQQSEKCGSGWKILRGVKVVWIQPKIFEVGGIGKHCASLRACI